MSLKIKLAVIISCLVSFTVIFFGNVMLDNQKESLEEQMRSMATTITYEFAQNSKFPLLENDRLSLNLMVKYLMEYPGITDAYVVSSKLLIDGASDSESLGKPFGNPEELLQKISKEKVAVLKETANSITFTGPILFSDTIVGYVIVLFSKDHISEKIEEAVAQSTIYFVAIILMVMGISVPIANQLLKPIFKLLEGTRQVALGNYSYRVSHESRDEMGELTGSFNNMAEELAKKEILKGAFDRYVSPDVGKEILENPNEFGIGGEKREVTILFADIRGFTALSRQLRPEKLVELLNQHFTVLTDVIFHFNGSVDKFMGDAVMGVFGSPVPRENHLELGIKAAFCMKEVVSRINKYKRKAGDYELPIGIGVDCGEVIVGNMGSNVRMEFTAIGDAVNLSSRLAGVADAGELIVRDDIISRIEENVVLEKFEARDIKGLDHKIIPCNIVELKGEWKDEVDEIIKKVIDEEKAKGIC